MAKEFECPNCGPGHKLTPKTDGSGICPLCNGTFTPGPEAKVVAVGEFDALKSQVGKLEATTENLRSLVAAQPPFSLKGGKS